MSHQFFPQLARKDNGIMQNEKHMTLNNGLLYKTDNINETNGVARSYFWQANS